MNIHLINSNELFEQFHKSKNYNKVIAKHYVLYYSDELLYLSNGKIKECIF